MKVFARCKWYSSDDGTVSVMFDDVELKYVKALNRDDHPNLRLTVGRAYSDVDLLGQVVEVVDVSKQYDIGFANLPKVSTPTPMPKTMPPKSNLCRCSKKAR